MTGKFAFWNYKLKEIYAELDGDVNWGLVNEDGWFGVYSISECGAFMNYFQCEFIPKFFEIKT